MESTLGKVQIVCVSPEPHENIRIEVTVTLSDNLRTFNVESHSNIHGLRSLSLAELKSPFSINYKGL